MQTPIPMSHMQGDAASLWKICFSFYPPPELFTIMPVVLSLIAIICGRCLLLVLMRLPEQSVPLREDISQSQNSSSVRDFRMVCWLSWPVRVCVSHVASMYDIVIYG